MSVSFFANVGRAALDYLQRPASLRHYWPLLVALLGVALFWLALYWWEKQRLARLRARPARKENSLLEDLSAAHRLSQAEQQLLLSLATSCQLKEPAILFVDPRLWQRILDQQHAAQRSAVAQLYNKMFGSLTDVADKSGPRNQNGSTDDAKPISSNAADKLGHGATKPVDDRERVEQYAAAEPAAKNVSPAAKNVSSSDRPGADTEVSV